jgi:tetratricopeptide (TPR) repeat protein
MNTAALSDLEIGAMRREMQQAAGRIGKTDLLAGNDQINSNPNQPQGTTTTPPTADPNIAKPMATPADAPKNDSLPAGQLQSNVNNNALGAGLATGASVRSRVLVPPELQSETNRILAQRMREQNGQPQNDVDASRQYNQTMLAMQQAKAAQAAQKGGAAAQANPAQPTPTADGAAPDSAQGTGISTGAAGGGANNAGPNSKAPPQVKSFSEGFQAKGPQEILKKGDSLMKDGKWIDAIEQYNQAQQIAPNNMLITVGRATAELGGSYYGRAEADLRTAFTQDPAMLQGQYDLRTMIGDDRLQFLVKDLKDIANKNPTQARPVFLLAYIAYNTGNERMAAGYLDLAEKRAGANDTFYGLVRKNWTLPATGDAPAIDLNKE